MYRPGDTVAPGRWGAIVLDTGPSHPAYARELLLEQVRAEVSPASPSRLRVAFGHADLAAASEYTQSDEHLFEVDALGPVSELDMLWVTWVRESLETGDLHKARRQAAFYWRGDPTSDLLATARPHWELLSSIGWQVRSLVDRPIESEL